MTRRVSCAWGLTGAAGFWAGAQGLVPDLQAVRSVASSWQETTPPLLLACSPFVQGGKLVVRTVEAVPAGEPLLHCYGPQAGEMTAAQRGCCCCSSTTLPAAAAPAPGRPRGSWRMWPRLG